MSDNPPKISPDVLARRIYDARTLLADLNKVNPNRAKALGMKLDNDPRGALDFVVREANKDLLGRLARLDPQRSGVVAGTDQFRAKAVDRCPVPLQSACDNLARLSHAEFSALRLAGQVGGSDFRGEVLYPDAEEGAKQLTG